MLAWRRGGFAVTDRPLAFIFAELERRFGIEIAVRVPLAETGSLTLFFPQPTHPEVILNDICTAKGLRYEATSHGFAVFRP